MQSLLVPQNAFAQLHTLDLSFNRLEGAAIVALGRLASLAYLNLSSNDLTEIPLQTSSVYQQSLLDDA
jgi:Leucine-rich repeat (LRR) protein